MRLRRALRAAVIGVLALAVTACAGLPTNGSINAGLEVGIDTSLDLTFVPDGPTPGASPEDIVDGFLEAGTSPAGEWAIARQFLAPELAETWHPEAAVTIDRWVTRSVTSEIQPSDEEAAVQVSLTPVASVDAAGAYTESSGRSSETPFELARNDEGEWRITSALDGIVLDEEDFPKVFRRYSLQFFDLGWQHLVPDPRWFPRRGTIATTITQAVVAGAPSAWLADSVRTAFPVDVALARDAVPVSADDQVADVALTPSALSLDPTTLGRMRLQLERSLAGAGVSGVRFTVDGRALDAELAEVVSNRIDPNTLVLTEDAFGVSVGDEVRSLPGVSAAILSIDAPIAAIDVSGDNLSAAVLVDGGAVYRVAEGRFEPLDARDGLIAPALDARGYTWSVPRDQPQELLAWSPDGVEHPVSASWPDASEISHLRLSPDGVRIAALVNVGAQEWVTLSAIIRDDAGVPIALGPIERVSLLPGDGRGLAWLGDDVLGVLTMDGEVQQLIELQVGGPGVPSIVPPDTVAIAGVNNVSGTRLLSSEGVVSTKRGTSWQEAISGVLVLATQSGR